MERVNVSAVVVIPEVIFNQDLNADLSLRHNDIIQGTVAGQRKANRSFPATELTSSAGAQYLHRGSRRRDTFCTRSAMRPDDSQAPCLLC